MKYILITFLLIASWQQTHAQCYIDRHSTNWYDAWVSCETSINPISSYGNTHWILYDLGYVYPLFDSQIWNANEPIQLENGIQNYAVDYSIDSVNWIHLGNYSLNQASGLPIYEGEIGPDFSGSLARYVLITPTSNYGGSCYGLSEIKIYVDENYSGINDKETGLRVVAFPNPFKDNFSVTVNSLTPEKEIKLTLFDILGRSIYTQKNSDILSNKRIEISNTTLVSGLYFLKIEHNEKQITLKLIKE